MSSKVIPNSLIEFKAGRLYRDGQTNWVRPDSRQGLCYLKRGDDALLRFVWKDLTEPNTEEELIVFPGDVTLSPVRQTSDHRVYVLKFESSPHRSFFWMQGNHGSRQMERALVERINELMESTGNEGDVLMGNQQTEHAELARESSGRLLDLSLPSAQVGGVSGTNLRRAPSDQRPGDDVLGGGNGVGSLRHLLSSIRVPSGGISLGDVLTPKHMEAVLRDERLRRALFPALPEDMMECEVGRVLRSPQFEQALRSLSYVLESGQAGALVGQLGLDPDAGTSVEAFLRAIAKQVKQEEDK